MTKRLAIGATVFATCCIAVAYGSAFLPGGPPRWAPFLLAAGWLLTPQGIVLAVWVGLVATSLAYLLFALALPVLQPGHIATLTLIEPVVATALGVLVLGESIAALGWVGCALILVALLVLGLREGRSAGDRHRRAGAHETVTP